MATIFFTLLVGGLWAFPGLYYTRTDPANEQVWLVGQTNLTDWAFEELPVSESAERLLVADETLNAQFVSEDGRTMVRAFSAKRFGAKPNDIGLFIHTPDRCWTMAGWKPTPAAPDHLNLEVHGLKMVFERRVFAIQGHRELVYFGGLVGGQPLPYRLDHNFSVGAIWAAGESEAKGGRGFARRASDMRLWSRVWDAFLSRRRVMGPKQFIRVSTGVADADFERGDRVLQSFLTQWLSPRPYAPEIEEWHSRQG